MDSEDVPNSDHDAAAALRVTPPANAPMQRPAAQPRPHPRRLLLLPPRPWLAAGWFSLIVCAASMYLCEKLGYAPLLGIALAVIAGFISYVAFVPWSWVQRLDDDRCAVRDLTARLRELDDHNREELLSSVILDRDDALGELSRAVHESLTAAMRSHAEARILHRTMRDTIERRTRQAMMQQERQSLCDALTGVGNRRMLEVFTRQLQHDVAAGRIAADEPLAAILADFDDFAQFNTALGRDAGDDCLVFLAELLHSSVRLSDQVVRSGGDSFLILLRGESAETASRIAERLRSLFNQMPWSHEEVARPTVSMGVGDVPVIAQEPVAEAARRAANGLILAQRAGGNRVAGSTDDDPHVTGDRAAERTPTLRGGTSTLRVGPSDTPQSEGDKRDAA